MGAFRDSGLISDFAKISLKDLKWVFIAFSLEFIGYPITAEVTKPHNCKFGCSALFTALLLWLLGTMKQVHFWIWSVKKYMDAIARINF